MIGVVIVVAINNRCQGDRSGVLEMNELQRLWAELMTWKGVFHQFDKDDSGFVDVSELKNVFLSVGQFYFILFWIILYLFVICIAGSDSVHHVVWY